MLLIISPMGFDMAFQDRAWMKIHDPFLRQHHKCLLVRIIGFSLGLEVCPKSTESGNGKAEISIEYFL